MQLKSTIRNRLLLVGQMSFVLLLFAITIPAIGSLVRELASGRRGSLADLALLAEIPAVAVLVLLDVSAVLLIYSFRKGSSRTSSRHSAAVDILLLLVIAVCIGAITYIIGRNA